MGRSRFAVSVWLWLVAVAIFLPVQAAAAESRQWIFEGERFSPVMVTPERSQIASNSATNTFVKFSDPDVVRLIAKTSVRLSWSGTRQTLMVYGPLQQMTVYADADFLEVDGQKQAAPGLMTVRDGEAYVEPALLFSALGLVPIEKGQQLPLTLLSAVAEPTLADTANGRVINLGLASPVRFTSERPTATSLSIALPNCAFRGQKRDFYLDDVHVTVSDAQASQPDQLTMTFTFPANWYGDVRRSLAANSLQIACIPAFRTGSQVNLENVQRDNGVVELKADAAFQYFWNFNEATRLFTIDMPRVTNARTFDSALLDTEAFSQVRLRSVGTMAKPVLRCQAILAPGYGFVFPETGDETGLLRFSADKAVTLAMASGNGQTFGYLEQRGTIVIDPGHGGGDPGCYSRALGIAEKTVTLDVALKLRDILQEQGWTVILTRETDRDVSWLGSPDVVELQSRCDVANKIDADFFVSLHCNASVSQSPAGTSVHWYKRRDLDLACSLEYALGEKVGFRQIGLIRDSFYVLRHTEMPAVLVEMAFLSNPREASLLADDDVRSRIAQGLAEALGNHATARYARGTSRPALKSAP